MRRTRILTDMSVATRLSLVALLVTLISLAVAASVGLRRGNELADDLAEDRLSSVAASRSESVAAYLRSMQREIAGLAISPATSDALSSLTEGYADLAIGRPPAAEVDSLTEYYLTELVPELERARSGPVGGSFLVPKGAAAIRLQSAYTVPREDDDGVVALEPALVVDAGDGSEYSATHSVVHPVLGEIAVRSGLDDLFLIDARTGAVVYSARKRTDFATSLAAGPLSGSSLATLIDAVGEDPEPGTALVADYAAYTPTADEPRLFIASPVFDDEQELIGYLAGSLTTEPLDQIMSGDDSWDGFGESGDAYVVGPDAVMRTTTRSFTEDPDQFTVAPPEPGPFDLTDAQRRRIAATGTTALVQPVSRQQISAVGSAGVERIKNYRGVDVVAAYRPVEIDGLDWRVVAEVDADELDGPIDDYVRNMIFAVAFFVVGVTFVAVRWSDRLIAPIRHISARLRAVRADGIDAIDDTVAVVPDDSPTEYLELSANIDDMLDRLRDRSAEVASRAEERSRLVAEFLPAAAAQRRQAGDEVIDHVRAASVAVLVLDGVRSLVEGMGEHEQRRLLADIVDQVDELAADFGLERVKITGTAYFAVCGVSRPYLDHAPRSVRFALAAAELVDDLSRERRADLSLSAGVESGAIAVGLSGRAGLVYDVWGAAVHDAAELARRAPRGTVSVSAGVREQLPAEFVFADAGSGGGATVVTARVGEVSS